MSVKDQRESRFQAWFLRWLTDVAAKAFHIHGSVFQKSGIPDVYCAHRIWRGWIELKVDDHQVEPHQRKMMQDLVDRGDTCVVVRGFSRDSGRVLVEDFEGNAKWQSSTEDAVRFLRELALREK